MKTIARMALAFLLAVALVPAGALSAFGDPADRGSYEQAAARLAERLDEAYQLEQERTYVNEYGYEVRLSDESSASVEPLSEAAVELPEDYTAPYTSVKSQGITNSCWAFAAIASFESAYMKQKEISGSGEGSDAVDFSEAQLVYGTFNGATEDGTPDGNELSDSDNDHLIAQDVDPFTGGSIDAYGYETALNWYYAAGTLAAGRGVSYEDDVPLSVPTNNADELRASVSSMATSAAEKYDLSRIRLNSAEKAPEIAPVTGGSSNYTRAWNEEALPAVKRLLHDNGALTILYYADAAFDSLYYHENPQVTDDAPEEDGQAVVEEDEGAATADSAAGVDSGSDSGSDPETNADLGGGADPGTDPGAEDETIEYDLSPNYWVFDADEPGGDSSQYRDVNHVVTVVGWDDTYSRWNFATPLYDESDSMRAYDDDIATVETGTDGKQYIVPKIDGAWLVKNSWGTEMSSSDDSTQVIMGDEGMFYFSYCEKTIMYPSVFVPDNDPDGSSYEIVQQYDGVAPEPLTLNGGDASDCANVFTAEENQVIEAVGAWSPTEAMDISLSVYVDLADPSNPESGTLVAQQSDFYPYEGFCTIELKSPVSVDAGETYSIVMTFKKDTSDGEPLYYLPAECEGAAFPEQSYISEGESFVEDLDDEGNAIWIDAVDVSVPSGLSLGNVCIKAYANPAPEPEPEPDPEPDPDPAPGDYPSEFDLRDEGLVTSVKMQNPWGTCWAFGSLASLESTVLKDGGSYEGAEPNYSERQLAWVGRTAVGDETDPSQAGEGSYTVRTDAGVGLSDSALVLNGGGDFGIAAAALAAWEGAANEADIPYTNRDGEWNVDMTAETAGDWSVDDGQRSLSAVHVQDVDIIPGTATFEDPEHPSTEGYVFNEEALDEVKQLLMDEGAVGVFYYADASWPNEETGESDYMNYFKWAQYVYQYGTVDDPDTEVVEDTRPNHLVTIVGWDDSYDKENFSADPAKQPPADGAWIVKNSWGDSSLGPDWAWGIDEDGDGLGDGYFYLSYYDMTVAQFASFRGDTPDADGSFDYDTNYQYDYLGIGSVCKVEPGSFGDASAANVFTAEGDESLRAVSAVTAESGSTVQVQVYLLDESAQSPTDGVLVSTQTEEVALSGYHTIELDRPVKLSAGQRFAVVESVDGAQGAYLPLEVAGWDPADPDEAASKFTVKKQQTAVANAGESFYSTDGGAIWTDASSLEASDLQGRVSLTMFGGSPEILGVGNAMIKAFTVDDEASAAPVLPGGSGGLADTGDPLVLGTFLTCAIAAVAATTALVARRKRQ